MPVRKIKPTTPGQRFKLALDYSELTKKKPEKSLLYAVKRTGGRNNTGRITVDHRGGGTKRRGRLIDFKRQKFGVVGSVKSIEYDPMRTAFIALIYYKDGEKAYILAPAGIKVGQQIISGPDVAPEIGNAMPMGLMPPGTYIHNIELHPKKGGALVRGAGTGAQLVTKEGKYVTVKLPSGERRLLLATCMATVGRVSNKDHGGIVLGKAGARRHLGWRPRVRGVAMNPVDHPMGGGEGKASGGHPRSRKGIMAKGEKTRKKKKYSNKMIFKHNK